MLRAVPARWFELLVARDDLMAALEALARTGLVELETRALTEGRIAVPDLEDRLQEYQRLARRYQPYWPEQETLSTLRPPRRPSEALDQAMAELRRWCDQADPLVVELEALRARAIELRRLDAFLSRVPPGRLRLSQLAQAGPALAARLYVLPVGTRLARLPSAVITRSVPSPENDYLLAVGPAAEMPVMDREMVAYKGRPVALPAWLSTEGQDGRAQVAAHRETLEAECRRLVTAIDALSRQHEVGRALAEIARLRWFLDHAGKLPVSDSLGWVTGWTSDPDGARLRRALSGAELSGLLRVQDAPPAERVPTVLSNPWWARPFEVFARLLGTPGRDEADPSPLLALLVPLMFGYMFGDVGQGLVLLLTGVVLSRRWPGAAILIPCGLSAALFGFAFGSVFSREDLLAPLWLHPLEHPIPVLALPLAGGVVVLVIGQLLNGVEAYWRGELGAWLRVDCALMSWYLALVVGVLRIEVGALLAVAALLWYLVGCAWQCRLSDDSFPGRLAHLLESTLQLAVNTVSFARVGAFALAHAGVSLAIVTLADANESGVVRIAVLVLGNVVVLVLEGLVVSIQTTRLVLFEFFIRFLRGEGRVFRPITPPAATRISNLGSTR